MEIKTSEQIALTLQKTYGDAHNKDKSFGKKNWVAVDDIKKAIIDSLKEGFSQDWLGIDLETCNHEQLLVSLIMDKLNTQSNENKKEVK